MPPSPPPSELVYEEAVSGRPRMPPLTADVDVVEYLDGLAAAGRLGGGTAVSRGTASVVSPSRTGGLGGARRLNATSVRLCNNQLTTLQVGDMRSVRGRSPPPSNNAPLALPRAWTGSCTTS